MIESGLLLFFLIPGLLSYCGFYGTFHSGKSIAPEPPAPSSIEIVTLVLLSSAVVHFTSGLLIHGNHLLVKWLGAWTRLPGDWLDPYAAAFKAIGKGDPDGDAIALLIGIALLQGILAYAAVRLYLRHLAKRDRLPAWIYGWATDIANAADNDDKLILAYVLTTHDHGGKPVVYAGVVYNMALKADGCITRITLWDCERYLADLDSGADDATLPAPSSNFPFMILHSDQIRNVAFEVIDLGTIPPS